MNNSSSIFYVIVRFLIYIILVLGLTQLLFVDTSVTYDPEEVQEATITEWMQLTFLAFILVFFYLAGNVSKVRKPFVTVLIGVAMVVFIREIDWFFETYIFEGAWQILTLIILAFFSINVYRERDLLAFSIKDFIKQPSFGIILCGFLTTFVFAPVLGRLDFWVSVMDGYLRAIANGAEEGVELLGYFFILVGAFEYFLNVKKPKVST